MALNECVDPTSYLQLVKLHTAISSIRQYPRLKPTGLKCIEKILEQDGDINYQIPNTVMLKSCRSKLVGCTILHLHARLEDRDILNLLLDHGADFTIKIPEGQTVIHDYYINTMSWKLQEDCWSYLEHPLSVALVLSAHLKNQITENPVDPNGLSHFHAACMTNNIEAMKFFLDNGVSVQQRVNEDSPVFAGYTPLHFATRFDCLEAVKLLLLRGVKVDAQDAKKMTPLDLILYETLSQKRNGFGEPKKCIDVIGELARVNNNIDAQGHLGVSYLHVLCTLEDSSRLERHLKDIEDVDYVVSATSSVRPGSTALHFAALFNLDSLKLLVAKGGDITIKDAEEKTALNLCIARYDIEHIHDILARSTFKDITLSDGKTKLTDLIYSMRSLSHFQMFLQELGDVNAHIPVGSALWPGHTPLHLVIILQDGKQREMLVQMTEECLKTGVDVHTKGVLDCTPLQFAFRRGRAEAVDLMLKYHRGTSNPVDEDGLSLLHIACAARNESLAEALFDHGADVDCKLGSTYEWYGYNSYTPLRDGSTPLHVAVAVGDNKMARLLLNRGADPQAQDADGMSVLHRLMFSGSWKLLDELLTVTELRECVAESCGLSHLHVACYAKHLDAVKKLLLQPEVQVDRAIVGLSEFNHDTPLRVAMSSHHDEKGPEVVKLLLQHGADILADGDWEKAPLRHVMTRFADSTEDRYWNLFVAAIRSDENLRRRVGEQIPGLTDLHLACFERDLQWIGELLATGVDVNARIRDDSPIWSGYTPLYVLMEKRWVKKDEMDVGMRLLLDRGADVTVPGGDLSNTPLHLAEIWSCRRAECYNDASIETEDCRELHRVKKLTLRDVPCDRASLMVRSIKDFTSNPMNVAGVSVFHIACRCLDVAAVEGFLKQGVDVNAKLDYFYDFMGGYTPLHVTLTRKASSPRKKKIVELLLKYGADLRAESYSGNTALHYAAMYHANVGLPIFVMILNAGADINAKNVLGASPLEILLKEGEVSIEWMKHFIERGCRINDFNCVSDEGLMPMIFAARKLEKQDVIPLVLKSPNIGEVDEMGRSAIHNIVSTENLAYSLEERDYAKLIDELEKLGCDVDRQDKSGQTALHAAARFHNDQAIAALLAAGADVNVIDAAGKMAFAYTLLKRRQYKSDRLEHRFEYDDAFNRHAVELFVDHVSKLRLAGLHVDALNVRSQEMARDQNFIFRPMDANYFRAILDHVDNASVKVGSESMTLRDFVSANGPVWKYSQLRRMNRDHVVELFNTILDERYGKKLGRLRCLVRLQYRNYLARSRLVKDAKSALNVIANFRVPELCSEFILAYCANWELRNVIEATN